MTSILCLAAMSAEILWTKPICVETNRYIGWPTVCCCANGELLAVFSGDRDRHVCPYGKVQLVRSKDGGETRSEPVTIRNSSLDDRDAGIIELKDGSLAVGLSTTPLFSSCRMEGIPRTWAIRPRRSSRTVRSSRSTYQVAKPHKTPCLMATKWQLDESR